MHEIPESEMKERPGSGTLEFFMKNIHARNMMQKWEEMAPFLPKVIELGIGCDYIECILYYTLPLIEKNDKIRLEELLINNLNNENGESIVTSLAQSWLDEGIQKGKLEGKLEGELKGKLEVTRNMLKNGLDIGLIARITGLPIADIKSLKTKKKVA